MFQTLDVINNTYQDAVENQTIEDNIDSNHTREDQIDNKNYINHINHDDIDDYIRIHHDFHIDDLVDVYDKSTNISSSASDSQIFQNMVIIPSLHLTQQNVQNHSTHSSVRTSPSHIFHHSNHSSVQSFVDVDKYNNDSNNLFYKLELFSTFINGQKEIYLMSRNIMNFRQNFILILASIIGGIATILSIKSYNMESLLIITILNSFITILIAIAGIFKFDVKGERFFHISNSFHKLEMYIETSTSQLQFIHDIQERDEFYLKKIKFIEKIISSLKDDNNYPLPSFVIYIFPILTKINIFKYIQIHPSINELIRYNIDHDIENGSNIFQTIQNELYNEIHNADLYNNYLILFYICMSFNHKTYNEFVAYKLL